MLWSKQTASVYTFSITAADKPVLLVSFAQRAWLISCPRSIFYKLAISSWACSQLLQNNAITLYGKLSKSPKIVEDKITAFLDYGSLWSHNEIIRVLQM